MAEEVGKSAATAPAGLAGSPPVGATPERIPLPEVGDLCHLGGPTSGASTPKRRHVEVGVVGEIRAPAHLIPRRNE